MDSGNHYRVSILSHVPIMLAFCTMTMDNIKPPLVQEAQRVKIFIILLDEITSVGIAMDWASSAKRALTK